MLVPPPGKKCLRPWPGMPWVRPAGCRRRRRSFGDAAVILVPAATIQTYTYDTYTYMQYRHIQTLTHQRKLICHDLGRKHFGHVFLQENLTGISGGNAYWKIQAHTYNTCTYMHIVTLMYVTCYMYLKITYIKIDTIHTNTNKIHTEKTSLKKSRFIGWGCMYSYVFVCIGVVFVFYFVCILYVLYVSRRMCLYRCA